jgi:hypothetical protein
MALAEHRFQKSINLAAVSLMSQLMTRIKVITFKHGGRLPNFRSSGNTVRNELITDFYGIITEAALRPVENLVAVNQDLMPATIKEIPGLVIETFIALMEKQKPQWLELETSTALRQLADGLNYIVSDIREIADQIRHATDDLPYGHGR